jgi:hypothetical protein
VEERRVVARRIACIPAYLDSRKDVQELALIRDVSARGARLFTRTLLPNGLAVQLLLYIRGEEAPPTQAGGRVVRSDRRELELSDVWPWEVGVEFDEPLEASQAEIEELSRRQEAMGIIKPPG